MNVAKYVNLCLYVVKMQAVPVVLRRCMHVMSQTASDQSQDVIEKMSAQCPPVASLISTVEHRGAGLMHSQRPLRNRL